MLPFSLLHNRDDQYRFTGGSQSGSTEDGTGDGTAMAGYHEQVLLDAACSRIISTPPRPGESNVTQREDPRPAYNEILIFDFLRIALSNENWLFYSKVVFEHMIAPTVATADGARVAMIQHLFAGGCIAQGGSKCKDLVQGEDWSQSVGIKIIDLVCEWADIGKISAQDLRYICHALGFSPSLTNQRRSLLAKLAAHRRHLICALDIAQVSLQDTLRNMGTSSSIEKIHAVCGAHDIPLETREKTELIDNVIDHITNGNCSEKKGPGCESVAKELLPTAADTVHMQVSVLQHIHSLLSVRQLHKVLDIHGIKYDEGETKRKLKYRLTMYIRALERGKVKEAEAMHDRAERLLKLEEIRKSWPKLVPPQLKEDLVKEFKNATSSSALASFTCACCACELPVKERQRKIHTEVNMELLRSPTKHWNSDQVPPPPTSFTEGPLAGKLLDAKGVQSTDGETFYLDFCTLCLRGLHRDVLPKRALANRLYLGPVPSELSELTMVEECFIARARAKSWIVKLQETEGGPALPTTQRGFKGHTIIYPQEPEHLATMLPPPVDEVLSFICIIFVGSSKPTKEWLRTKAKPLVVRREKVYNALRWLKDNNPVYKDIEIAAENLESLPDEDVLNYHIEQVAPDDAQETLVSRYDNGSDAHEPCPDLTLFDSVVISDVDAHTPTSQLAAAAVRHMKTKGKPFLQVGHGSKPMNEFCNTDLFPMLYPTLFPYGCGGFEDKNREKPISLKEHVKYLFSLSDRRFQTHYSFLFTVFNIIQRRALLLHTSLKVKKSYFSKFARDFSSVSSEAIGEVLQQLERGERVVARTDDERRVLRLMKEVNLVTSKVPGSSASRVAMRNEIRSLTIAHGMPSFYITINPADTHNPIVKFLAGSNIDIDRMLADEVPKFWEQSMALSSNPAVGARFFNLYLKAFLRVVLGYTEDKINLDGGILGTVKAHYGCVEAQGRGSLHCHMLIWVEGALNPNEIREKVMADASWGQRLLEYLDDLITNVVPADPMPDTSGPLDDKDPCTLRGADLSVEDVQSRLAARMKDLSRLAERVQRHHHTHTCYKHCRPGEVKSCRFDLSGDNFRSESTIDPENGNVSLRCLDGLVNNFNTTILEAMRCNMDIQFIGSGESAKAMIYYVTDYITKSQLKSHVSYAALQLAVKRCEQVSENDDDFTVKSKRLLQKCAFALVSHQEMSAQQVASYLMDYEDHFTSHKFGNLYWPSFERLVDREDPLSYTEAAEVTRESEDVSDENSENNEEKEPNLDSSEASLNPTLDLDNQEEVSISINETGGVTELADQVSDYTLRPDALQDFCLWDFVAKTSKVYCRKGKQHVREEGVCEVDDEEADDIDSGSESESVEPNTEREPMLQKKEVSRYEFLNGHKELGRKILQMRKRDIVPVPIGPSIPRRDQPEVFERYCRLMLILFKPWRRPGDLRTPNHSWATSFSDFVTGMAVGHRAIVENMQVLHECRDSRDDHMQTRSRQRVRPGRDGVLEGRSPENELEEIDVAEVLEHLSEIDRMCSRRTDVASKETKECLGELEKAGWYGTPNVQVAAGDDLGDGGLSIPDREDLEGDWKSKYESRKAEWKTEAKQAGICDQASGSVQVSVLNDVDMGEEGVAVPVVNDIRPAEGLNSRVGGALVVMEQVVEKWTLNKEQKRAFSVVARHTLEDEPEQLRMYLGGPGGTGKSRVVSALREFFDLQQECRRFRLAAYTGVAAMNIGGATLHSLLQMNDSGRQASARTKRDLAAMWDGVDYLFVDEVSMIGCEMMHNISVALTEAKGKTSAFGGLSVIFAGDFAQLPPVGDVRLYKNMVTSALTSGTSKRAQAKALGKLLWLSVETVVMLHETMRQAGAENARFVELLGRLRKGVCTDEDYALLRGRVLNGVQLTVNDEWRGAPVIVTSNATRDAINIRATKAFADRTGRELHWYHAVDTYKRSVITDPELIEGLEAQHSGQTKHRLRRIPLVLGMPVSINQNFDVRAGVVNGSWGYLRAVRFTTDVERRRYLSSCVVDIPGSDTVEMDYLPEHHFPVLPDVTELKFEHVASHKRCVIKRKQVPIEPGFAITAHKAQGKTMGKVVVDLAGCSGTEQPYVMVSRCTSIEGMVVLRDFDKSKVTKRLSEDLRKEFSRLDRLRLQSVIEYGTGDEVSEARDLLGQVHGQEVTISKKRRRREDIVRAKKVRFTA